MQSEVQGEVAEIVGPQLLLPARALFGGLKEASAKERTFDWTAPLELARAITAMPRDDGPEDPSALERGPDWSAAWRASVDLIAAGLHLEDRLIPGELRPTVSEVLAFHLVRPDPYLDGAAAERDPASVAVGSLRCQALEGLIALAIFDYRGDPDAGLDPGLAALLEGRLDPASEPSPAERSVFGSQFGNLMIIDEPWARAQVDQIFPSAGDPRLWRAAWDGFVERSRPQSTLLELLENHYRRAVEEVSAEPDPELLHDPDETLVAQLMSIYLYGDLDLGEPGGLLPRFYELASTARRADAIEVIGRGLDNQSPIPAAVERRMRELVEWRLGALAAGGDTDELAGWSWWFTSDEFEVEWSLDFLRRLLGAGVSLGPDHMVAERLAALSDAYPAACIEALQLLIEAGVRPWFVIGSEEPITTILVTALAAGGDAGQRGRDLINVLVARGAIGFRGLLPGGGG